VTTGEDPQPSNIRRGHRELEGPQPGEKDQGSEIVRTDNKPLKIKKQFKTILEPPFKTKRFRGTFWGRPEATRDFRDKCSRERLERMAAVEPGRERGKRAGTLDQRA